MNAAQRTRFPTPAACVIAAFAATPAWAASVDWADWQSGNPGPSGSASGVFVTTGGPVSISYAGEIAFLQTGSGTDYYSHGATSPYTSTAVDNDPTAAEMIALSTATPKTLTFSTAVDNLFFAVVSLNGNGYQFNQDFEIVSSGCGYWGCGGFQKVAIGGGLYQLNSTGGEPHGVIRFTGAVSSITWTSLTNEYWNGFTVGTYGIAPEVPEPATCALWALGLAGVAARVRWRSAS